MKNDLTESHNLSPRKFIQTCVLGTAAIASSSILGGFILKPREIS